jgi:hypothetical protein
VPLLADGDQRRASLAGLEGRIVFACDGQIWSANPDGTGQRQLTQPVQIDWKGVRLYRVPEDNPPTAEEQAQMEASMNYAPRWLPDGRIVFASTRDTLSLSADATAAGERRPFVGASELYVVNDDGSGLERLTDYNLAAGAYTSPFGGFDPSQCGAPNFCFAGQLTMQPATVAHTQPMVATHVTEIRFSECCAVFALLDLRSATTGIEVASELVGVEQPSDVRTWSWSADDAMVLMTVWSVQFAPDPSATPTPPELRLYRDGIDRQYELLPDFVGPGATLSPDGSKVAYCNVEDVGGAAVLYVAGVSDSKPQEVANGQYCDPAWSPDGRYLVDTDAEGRVAVIDIQSGEVIPVTLGSDPDWGP